MQPINAEINRRWDSLLTLVAHRPNFYFLRSKIENLKRAFGEESRFRFNRNSVNSAKSGHRSMKWSQC